MKLAWQQIPSPIITDILCQNKLAGLVIDTEHAAFNAETLFSCIQVATLNNKVCLVRLTEVNKTQIRQCLDAGVNGLIFSTVETAEQANKIHNFSKFPSHGGSRGLGLVRENLWGKKNLISEPPILIAQIETTAGVKNIKSISETGFDYYMIGPYDLTASLGFPGDFSRDEYISTVQQVKKTIPLEKMAVHIPSNVNFELKKYEKYGIVAMGMDTTFLIEKYQEIENHA